jgi:hypothetical protein
LRTTQISLLRNYLATGTAHDRWAKLLDDSGILARRGDAAALKSPTTVDGAINVFSTLPPDLRALILAKIPNA